MCRRFFFCMHDIMTWFRVLFYTLTSFTCSFLWLFVLDDCRQPMRCSSVCDCVYVVYIRLPVRLRLQNVRAFLEHSFARFIHEQKVFSSKPDYWFIWNEQRCWLHSLISFTCIWHFQFSNIGIPDKLSHLHVVFIWCAYVWLCESIVGNSIW